MGYLSIPNQYRPEAQFMWDFKQVVALEKVHGTSAHISFQHLTVVNPESPYANTGRPVVGFFAGGESYDKFKGLFNEEQLLTAFQVMGHDKVMVYGEAYGGKQQGMSDTYGKTLCFVVFDVRIGDTWLSVENAHDVATKLGLEFVPYEVVPMTPEAIDAARNKPSEIAVRRGIKEPKVREGIVIRPLHEYTLSNGQRAITKHKNPEFSERTSKRDTVADPDKQALLDTAEKVALDFVTPMRLQHVMDKLVAAEKRELTMADTPTIIKAMQEDVYKEGRGEFADSKEVRRAIGAAAGKLFKKVVCKL